MIYMENTLAKADTQTIAISGTLEWAKVFEENRDQKGPDGVWEDIGGKTCIDVIIDEDQKKILEDSGSRKTIYKQDDGTYRVKFDRPWTHDKYPQYGGPPLVFHADGKTKWDLETDGLIGNGSKGVVYIAVYPAGKFMGTRLNIVQVVEHVLYESSGIVLPDLRKDSEKTKVPHIIEEDIDDEIPFGED